MESSSREPGTPSVKALLRSPAYRQSASERQIELLNAIRRLHVEIEVRQRDLSILIEAAQRQGISWSHIGQSQGVTAQAAQQRFKRWKNSQKDSNYPTKQGNHDDRS